MNETVYAVAIAGLLHDVGKFAERAMMELPVGYARNNEDLYQPEKDGRRTHIHALYTAAFIEEFSSCIPFSPFVPGSDFSLINLAAMHHKPETPLQKIITIADCLSSGLDRQEFEDHNEINFRNFRKTRLLPIAEEMFAHEGRQGPESLDGYHYRYRLSDLNPDSVLPGEKHETEPKDDRQAKEEYAAIFLKFKNEFRMLPHKEAPGLWLRHFVSLWERYASFIPAATVGKVIPDVSLFDHCRATSALAAALYAYHHAHGTLTERDVADNQPKKFCLITGDFSGIQKFIFSEGGSTNQAAAKLLRGRSFAVSLLSELAAMELCRALDLPVTSIILNAAGKFTLIAPNLPDITTEIQKVQQRVNDWLVDEWFGEVTISLSSVEASPADFEMANFSELWQRLGRSTEQKKYRRIEIERLGVRTDYLDRFDNRLDPSLCPFCGKRPSHRSTKGDYHLGDEKASCLICRDHIYLGAQIIKAKTMALLDPDPSFDVEGLKAPLFGKYQVSFDLSQEEINSLIRRGGLIDISCLGMLHGTNLPYAVRVINGYVPVYTDDDLEDDRIIHGRMSEEKKLEMIEMMKKGGVKSFHHIVKTALTKRPGDEAKFSGVEALGILKADVDNLGAIFGCGLPKSRLNLSRLATFSRQMNSFFSLYLPHLFSTDLSFREIYTVFAGGDDLFLIGPWNRIIDFADELDRKFSRFACKNPNITISVGITVSKPGVPVPAVADRAEEALEASKHGGRNSVTLFDETVSWHGFRKLLEIRDTLESWQQEGLIEKALLYQLNDLIRMARREKDLVKNGKPIELRDMKCLAWRSRLYYTITRNVGKGMQKDARIQAVEKVMKHIPVWVSEYDSKLRIALWQVLYKQR